MGAVGALARAGIVQGDADGAFHPDRLATRAEVTIMLVRAVQKGMVMPLQRPRIAFPDRSTFPEWAASAIEDATAYGLVYGYPSGEFAADKHGTRAELAAMIYRLVAER